MGRMEKLLRLLQRGGRQTDESLARECGLTAEEVAEKVAQWEADGVIRGYKGVIDETSLPDRMIKALIEVKIKPEAGGGYDRLANRIAKFDQVISCSLFSGQYDLLLEVEVKDSLAVATFVFDTLSKIDGVISTQTHFPLKTYKLDGICLEDEEDSERLPVTP